MPLPSVLNVMNAFQQLLISYLYLSNRNPLFMGATIPWDIAALA
jgi:hypothetical protein